MRAEPSRLTEDPIEELPGQEQTNPWLDPNFRPDGSRNVMVGMKEQLEQWAQLYGPVLRPSTNKPPSMPDALRGAHQLGFRNFDATQGDKGRLLDAHGNPIQSTELYEEATRIRDEELRGKQGLQGVYVSGGKVNPALEAGIRIQHLLPENTPLVSAFNTGGRALFNYLEVVCLDMARRREPNKTHIPGKPGLEWPSYGAVTVGGVAGDLYKGPGVMHSALNPEQGITTADELEEAIQKAENQGTPISHFMISTPGNPGLSTPHDELVKLIQTAAKHGVVLWVDNFYGALAPEPTVNVDLLRRELSSEEMSHVIFIGGNTKWNNSNTRDAWGFAVGEKGPAVDVMKETQRRLASTAAEFSVETEFHVPLMLAFFRHAGGAHKAIGAVGTNVQQRLGRMQDILERSGRPFMMSGVSYYAFVEMVTEEVMGDFERSNQRPMTVGEKYAVVNMAFAMGESFMPFPGCERFGRISGVVPDSTLDMYEENLISQ